jgi:hypothetical protein
MLINFSDELTPLLDSSNDKWLENPYNRGEANAYISTLRRLIQSSMDGPGIAGKGVEVRNGLLEITDDPVNRFGVELSKSERTRLKELVARHNDLLRKVARMEAQFPEGYVDPNPPTNQGLWNPTEYRIMGR